MTTLFMDILWFAIPLFIVGFALYLIYGFLLGCLTVTRLILRGLMDMVTLKSFRQELHKFRG